MNEPKKQNDKLWGQCPPGAIQEVAKSAKVTRPSVPATDLQRRKMIIGAATAAGVVALGGISYLATRNPAGDFGPVPRPNRPIAATDFADISCEDVIDSLTDYIAEKVDDQEKAEKIKKHLELCESCRFIYELRTKS